MQFDKEELAWCAGFFDGEGASSMSLNTNNNHSGSNIYVGVTQKNPLLLYRFQKAIGGFGGISGWTWRATNFEHIQYVMCQVWNKLGSIKRRQYKDMITCYLSTCWKPSYTKEAIYRRENYKHGSAAAARIARWSKFFKSSNSNYKFINPFEKAI
jgi:hypothetical protein